MRKLGLISIIGVFLATNVFAYDLSFDVAVEKIMTESEDIKKADANLKKATAGLDAANANRWFQIEGTATYMNMVDVSQPFNGKGMALPPEFGGILEQMTGSSNVPDNIFMAGATITQPIYTFGKIGNAVDGMRHAIKMSETGREITKREVRYAAANLYWTAKMTDGLVSISEKSLSDAKSAKQKLTSAGRANRSNLVKIEADIASKEISLSDAKFNRDTAHRMLKIMAGIDLDEDIKLVDDIPTKFSALDAPELKANPEWDLYEQQIKMYESNARSKRAGNYPTLAAMASYNFVSMGDSADNMFDKQGSQSAYWGLALQVPIFNGGLNRAQATVEVMNAEASRQDLDKSKKVKNEEYNTAVKKYEHLRGNLASLENARDLAAKAYSISRDRFAAGQTSAVELSEVSSALSQLDMALLNAKYNILMSAESVKKIGE
jgi:multidrug efflux system outer membrane protein